MHTNINRATVRSDKRTFGSLKNTTHRIHAEQHNIILGIQLTTFALEKVGSDHMDRDKIGRSPTVREDVGTMLRQEVGT